MKIGIIIQARLGSTRLPGKIKKSLGTKFILDHVIDRCRASRYGTHIVLACPENPTICMNEEIFIGDEKDVLDRYYKCAEKYNFDVIVRITADCPLVPPYEIERCVETLLEQDVDYVTNIRCFDRFGLPDGFDVEAFTFNALHRAWTESTGHDREHVTPWIKRNLTCVWLEPIKLSIDTEKDLKVIRRWYESERKVYLGDRRDGVVCDPLHQGSTTETSTQSHTHLQ